MRTVVIAGGTRGIGGALAGRLARHGDRVVAFGSAEADLSSARETRKLLDRLPTTIDVLVLAAGRFDQRRIVTAEGLEQTFAISVLSRYLLAEGLHARLERAGTPIVLNLSGTGGIRAGRVHWDDLQLTGGYSLLRATMQAARANDLLGAGHPVRHPGTNVRYVLYNPLFVDSGMHRQLRQPLRTLVGAAAAVLASSTDDAAKRLVALLDKPPPPGLSAFRRGRPLPVDGPEFDPAAAARLYERLDGL